MIASTKRLIAAISLFKSVLSAGYVRRLARVSVCHDRDDKFAVSSNRKSALLLGFVLCCSLSGCNLCHNVKRTIFEEPDQFWWKADRRDSIDTYRYWAERVWRQQSEAGSMSCHYAEGFVEGFAQYVYAGGTGEPPPVPPRKYWNVDARNPRGNVATTDWFAGYRNGARVARAEGYRERVLVSASDILPSMMANLEKQTHAQYVESPSLPFAEPLPSSHLKPELAEPEIFNTKPPSESKLPETSSIEVPAIQAPIIEQPAPNQPANPDLIEVLPSPESVQEQPNTDLKLGPIENAPQPSEPSLDVDAIFDSSASNQVSLDPLVQRTSNLEASSSSEDQFVQQARNAFSLAIRRKLNKNTAVRDISSAMNRSNFLSSDAGNFSEDRVEQSRIILPQDRKTISRTTEISPSDRKAAEMFRRYSQ